MNRMNGLMTALVLTAGACALPTAAAVIVTDGFGNPNNVGAPSTWTNFNGTDLRSTGSGFSWTGKSSNGIFAFLDQGADKLIDARGASSSAGSYAYTIFDSTGGNTADTDVTNLQSVSVDWVRVDSTDGLARIMIRDASGGWFLSDDTIAIIANSTTSLDATTTAWTSVTSTTTLDDVLDDNTDFLTLGAAGTPDLSSVTGGGVYWESFTNTGAKVVRLDAITFTGAVPEPASMALLGLGSMLMLTSRRR